ncbi:MAG: SAM-dependent methyltransferase [Candidatus Promineofilum sp.]|nr:SAM-dependent methyltransferase [Promineifilum sp.]
MSDSSETLLSAVILNAGNFVEAVFQGIRQPDHAHWQRVTIRPILLRGQRYLQFSFFDGRQTFARNYHDQAAEEALKELLDASFKSIQATTTEETIRIQYSKKGRPIIHRQPLEAKRIELDMAHNRAKPSLLDEETGRPFLTEIGVMTADGRIRASQQRKFRQINEFLRLVEEIDEIDALRPGPLSVVDLGCGSAALSFATYHYFNDVKGLPTSLTGVDTKAHLMERHQETAGRLGWDQIKFVTGRIIDFEPAERPDIVLALHACDTATDEALAQAVRWCSPFIFSAPCCHHHLQAQLATADTPDPFRPVMRHGIMRERLGDVLTDAFRAHILRLMGYRAEVLEFVAVEHTPKNLMIRAVLVNAPPLAALIDEYVALKAYWGVTPYLEELLGEDLRSILTST